MKTRGPLLIMTFLLLIPGSEAAMVDHSLFTQILKTHVINGRVDYYQLKNDPALKRYLSILERTNPYSIKNRNDRLAYWINAYNAFTLKIICDNYPVKSIKDISRLFSSVWDRKFIRIKNRHYSLNDIEHRIIRKRFNEPRIHFALVCAAKSCPPLRSEAFTGRKLDLQLKNQGIRFLQNRGLNSFNLQNKKASLSRIFKWYRKDFPRNDEKFLLYLAEFTTTDISRAIKKDPSHWSVSFNYYDWRLNKQ